MAPVRPDGRDAGRMPGGPPPTMRELRRRPMVPEDLLRLQFVSDPQISPDGRRVAFVVTTLSEARDEYLSTIWIAETGGGEPRPFTRGPRRDREPRWSPDGRWLAFTAERGGRRDRAQLYVMPTDGGEPVRLTDLRAGVAQPAWSPDGRRLAFVSRVGGWVEPDDEEERAKSKPPRVIEVLKYRSNGIGFIHDRPRQVFVVDRDGGSPRQLTAGDFEHRDPVWSPDGRAIAFVSARHPDRDLDTAAEVWLVSPEGGEPRRLTDTAGPVAAPTFSPDGAAIAYLGHRHGRDVARDHRVFVVPVTGGVPVCLTEALDRNAEPMLGGAGLAWLGPRRVAFVAEDQGDVGLYAVDAVAGAVPERLVAGARQVTGFSATPDGALLAFAATDDVTPAEVRVCRGDGSGERALTDLNRAWRAEVALSRPTRFRFERAGFTIDGWIMEPIGRVPGRRYPALLNVHGGPASQYGPRFFDEFQVYAGAGYAVVYVNPRGSRGYGEAFARAVVGDWGGGDYLDVMAGLDEALRRADWIDPARLGVVGGSYGGFLTSWIVGHTDRFRAACSERAVNALWSMYGTSDIGFWFQEAHTGGRPPWEDLAPYLERSPLTYAAAIRTPLLILHSEDDLRCPIEQAEQLFVALKRLGRTVRFVRFPDEDHDLSRSGRPRHRLARFRILLGWFGEHLPPGPG